MINQENELRDSLQHPQSSTTYITARWVRRIKNHCLARDPLASSSLLFDCTNVNSIAKVGKDRTSGITLKVQIDMAFNVLRNARRVENTVVCCETGVVETYCGYSGNKQRCCCSKDGCQGPESPWGDLHCVIGWRPEQKVSLSRTVRFSSLRIVALVQLWIMTLFKAGLSPMVGNLVVSWRMSIDINYWQYGLTFPSKTECKKWRSSDHLASTNATDIVMNCRPGAVNASSHKMSKRSWNSNTSQPENSVRQRLLFHLAFCSFEVSPMSPHSGRLAVFRV